MKHYFCLAFLFVFLALPSFTQDTTGYPIMNFTSKGTNYKLAPAIEVLVPDLAVSNKDRLRLSAVQLKHLKELRAEFRKSIIIQENKLRGLEGEIDTLFAADNMDTKSISSKLNEIIKVQSDMKSIYFESMDRTESVLSGDQVSELINLTR
jgi:hypothetical protein